MTDIILRIFDADTIERNIDALAMLLHDCVHDGASISFVLPHTPDDSAVFWRTKVLPAVRAGGLLVLVAERSGLIVGSVQLDYDTPPNQPHRAEVRKLLVHPDFRRQGIARALMADLEIRAGALGRSLLTLDTRTGDLAEPLYISIGYQVVGIIPGFCRDPRIDKIDSTTILYKDFASQVPV
ncbi:GNAT family N-acetyltransferase [Thalassospira sp.]|uniref:GNAT family N-acetyltransferase n=1 Tax=Thalassospira sp. TaxID=1912094 RepID=UPI00273584D7|nr:GNAT family N-acetyltransferase [Thalassospira sp.]MDP2699067.1 GNAT family N-acetyltransferase [Thalassospira sp.]